MNATEIGSENQRIKDSGGTIFVYKPSFTDQPCVESSNEITYDREHIVLFIIHLLYVMEVLNVTEMLGKIVWRIKKQTTSFLDRESGDCCSSFVGFLCVILFFIVFLAFNPSMILAIFTPFPYIAMILHIDGEKCTDNFKAGVEFGSVICSLAILGYAWYIVISMAPYDFLALPYMGGIIVSIIIYIPAGLVPMIIMSIIFEAFEKKRQLG